MEMQLRKLGCLNVNENTKTLRLTYRIPVPTRPGPMRMLRSIVGCRPTPSDDGARDERSEECRLLEGEEGNWCN